MIDALKDYLKQVPDAQRLNRLREYLQWLILKSMDDGGFRKKTAFVGGTALRVIHKLPRFSEDLDFSLVSPGDFDAAGLADILQRDMKRLGLEAAVAKLRTEKTVRSFFLRFRNLLHPTGITRERDRVLSIKIEVDARPPKGGRLEEYLFPDPVMFWVTHFDLPSMFATKLHALFFRNFDKGRDFYDLIFFLRKGVQPNLELLQNAAQQTHPNLPPGERFHSLKEVFAGVTEKIRRTDMDNIRRDVRPFLLDSGEERLLTAETILKLIEQGGYA